MAQHPTRKIFEACTPLTCNVNLAEGVFGRLGGSLERFWAIPEREHRSRRLELRQADLAILSAADTVEPILELQIAPQTRNEDQKSVRTHTVLARWQCYWSDILRGMQGPSQRGFFHKLSHQILRAFLRLHAWQHSVVSAPSRKEFFTCSLRRFLIRNREQASEPPAFPIRTTLERHGFVRLELSEHFAGRMASKIQSQRQHEPGIEPS
jgi:hypothetical protein